MLAIMHKVFTTNAKLMVIANHDLGPNFFVFAFFDAASTFAVATVA